MTAIIYEASRALASGHTSGISYSFDIGLQALDRSDKQLRTRHKSIGGQSETWLQNIEIYYDIVTEPLDLADVRINYMREFLASTADGSEFQLDFDGTAAVPVSALSYELDSDTHKESRQGVRYLQFSFRVRKL
ncbi:MAG: hypothetical protein JWM78_1673 [Verrucomicrobiaceae bacterium]|nr:hypothetical protein [Verrucomicrobiaceae bacterium]